MTDHLPWFRCYPSKLLGALAAMKPDEGYVYWIVCLRIYETGHACRDSLDALARRTGMTRRRVSDALDLSFGAGRLVQENDGIMNPFAAVILKEANVFRKSRVHAGKKGAARKWEKRQQKQQNSDGTAMAEPCSSDGKALANDGHLHLHIHKQKKKSVELRSTHMRVCVDFELSEANIEYATKTKNWPRSQALSEGARFKNYCLANGKKYRDLDAAWRNWVTSPFQNGASNGQSTNGRRANPAPRSTSTGDHAILAGMANVARKRGLLEPAGGSEDREVQRGFDLADSDDAHRAATRGHR